MYLGHCLPLAWFLYDLRVEGARRRRLHPFTALEMHTGLWLKHTELLSPASGQEHLSAHCGSLLLGGSSPSPSQRLQTSLPLLLHGLFSWEYLGQTTKSFKDASSRLTLACSEVGGRTDRSVDPDQLGLHANETWQKGL